MKNEIVEYNEQGELSVVRTNMMNDKNYRGYCGNSWEEQKKHGCDMPRTKWVSDLGQFTCPKCGWTSQFPKEFIDRYKKHWGI